MKLQDRNDLQNSLKDEELIYHIKNSIYLLDRIPEQPRLIQLELFDQMRDPALKFLGAIQKMEQTLKSHKIEPWKPERGFLRQEPVHSTYQPLESVSSGLK